MIACTSCGNANPDGSRFCNVCGSALTQESPRREERKVVTVLFADLVGFTSRAERLDPEDVRAVLAPYWQHVRDELERFGGTVEKFIGDAVMALFGAPVAHEDDPERAVRAALAIRDWAAEQPELQVRIAVNTGEALVLLDARPTEGEGMAAGDVVNTAARLQASAPVNGVLVGEATHRATRGTVEYAEREPVVAKGKTEPLRVWEAVGARSRVTVETMSPAPLAGREEELGLLVNAFQRVRREQQPQLVTVAGVPGIGKSRLVAELFASVEAEPDFVRWRRGRSLPYGEGISLWALGEIAKAELGVLESDTRAETQTKLERSLARLVADAERPRLQAQLAPLLGLPSESAERAERFAAWRRWLELLAEERPFIVIFEDLQWADDELLDFVDELADLGTGIPLLVVCTTRPELFDRRPGWGGGKRNAIMISLGPLADTATARIVAATLDRAVLPAETQTAVLERAAGNPLYAEQYARMITEGAGIDELPGTVQGIVAARLDLLAPEEKALLQDASVIGRTFWPSALGSAAKPILLAALERKEFVRRERRSSLADEQEYSFAHALVRDVAYAQIPRAARAERHRRAALWLETLPPDRAEDRAEMVAHHYAASIELVRATGGDAAALSASARRAYREAGERALALNRLTAAAQFLTMALDLPSERDAERGRLLTRRSYIRRQLVGEDALADVEEAIAILRAAADPDGLAQAELDAATAYWLAGRGLEAAEHGERALALVSDRPSSPLKAEVLAEQARLLMLRGEMEAGDAMATAALELAEALGLERLQAAVLATRGAASGDPEDLRHGIAIAERGPYLVELLRGLNNLGEQLFRSGELAQQQEIYDRMRATSHEFGLSQQLAWTDGQEAALALQRGDWDRALELADGLIPAADAGHVLAITPTAFWVRAWIRGSRGESANLDVSRGTELARDAGDPQMLAPTLGVAARQAAQGGRRKEGKRLLDELAEVAMRSGGSAYPWSSPIVWAFVELDEPALYRTVLEGQGGGRWLEAALALCDGAAVRAAEIYRSIGSSTDEAEARVVAARLLRAAGDGVGAEREAALAAAFFASVRASARLRELDALRAATA